MKILGIETSCDETAVAIVEDGTKVLANIIESSAAEHNTTGGVVPEVAARDAMKKIFPAVDKAFGKSGLTENNIDALAVTTGPGLMGSLLVGVETARTLAYLWKKPLIPVQHIIGHICANRLEVETDIRFPILVLTVSGGHNDIILWKSEFEFERIGYTIDDAAGEAFDKGARILGLSFPGGPPVAKLAEQGNAQMYDFPRPMLQSGDLNFSFSGLKTALLYAVRDLGGLEKIDHQTLADLAASYQEAICDTLAQKLFRALDVNPKIQELHLTGGVSASLRLRESIAAEAVQRGITFRFPKSMVYCTDNAAMIAGAAYWKYRSNPKNNWSWYEVEATLKRDLV